MDKVKEDIVNLFASLSSLFMDGYKKRLSRTVLTLGIKIRVTQRAGGNESRVEMVGGFKVILSVGCNKEPVGMNHVAGDANFWMSMIVEDIDCEDKHSK